MVLKMFFRKKKQYQLLKLYHVVHDSEDYINKAVQLIELLEDTESIKFEDFDINYAEVEGTTLSQFKSGLERALEKEHSFPEYFSLVSKCENCSLSYGERFGYYNLNSKVGLFTLVFPESSSNTAIISSFLVDEFDLLYGYKRDLDTSYDSGTETKIQRGLFGGETIKVINDDNKWFIHPENILEGAIKGKYEENYIKKELLNQTEVQEYLTDSVIIPL